MHAPSIKMPAAPARKASPHVSSARRRKSSRGALTFTLVAIVALVAVVGGGVLLWINRTVNVKVNGALVSVHAEATLADIAEAQQITTTPGAGPRRSWCPGSSGRSGSTVLLGAPMLWALRCPRRPGSSLVKHS